VLVWDVHGCAAAHAGVLAITCQEALWQLEEAIKLLTAAGHIKCMHGGLKLQEARLCAVVKQLLKGRAVSCWCWAIWGYAAAGLVAAVADGSPEGFQL
jgi:hypothetical protein